MVKKTSKGETFLTLPNFRKFWIYDRPYGHDIVIYCDNRKTTIKCKCTDRDWETKLKV